jgi:hypothetical protein
MSSVDAMVRTIRTDLSPGAARGVVNEHELVWDYVLVNRSGAGNADRVDDGLVIKNQ